MREIFGVEPSLWFRCEDGPHEMGIADAVVVGCEAYDIVFVTVAGRAMSDMNVPDNCLFISRFLIESLRTVCTAKSISQSFSKQPGADKGIKYIHAREASNR
jgi:hypothetical protein